VVAEVVALVVAEVVAVALVVAEVAAVPLRPPCKWGRGGGPRVAEVVALVVAVLPR